MIIAFIVWIYIAFIGYSYGYIFFFLLKKLKIVDRNSSINFFFHTLTGLAFLSSIVGLLSIFYRINIEANIVLTLIAFLPFILRSSDYLNSFLALKSTYKDKGVMLMVVILYGLWTLFLGVVGDFHMDTGQYHAQAVKWTENYPVVYGLANLFGRLGYNSMFHVLSAFFSLPFLNLGSFRLLNSFFMLLLGWRVIHLWFGQSRSRFHLLYFAVLLFNISAFRSMLSSIATDTTVTILVYFVFIEFIEKMRNEVKISYDDASFWGFLMLLMLIVTSKISVAPIGVLMLFIAWQAKIWKSPKAMICIVLVGLFAFVPWMVRNVILSGYLVYPFPAIDIFDVDWKVPKHLDMWDEFTSTNSIESDKGWIYSYAFNADLEGVNWRDFIKLSLWEKYKMWFNLHKGRHLWYLAVLALFPIITLFFTSKKSLITRPMQLVGWTAYLGCLFLFSNAPDVRFCISFLVVCSLVMLFSVIKEQFFSSKLISFTYKIAWGSFFIIWLLLMVKDVGMKRIFTHENFILKPAAYPRGNFAQYRIGDFVQLVALREQRFPYSCWDAPLPCSDHFKTYLELRGKTLQEGFRVNWDKIKALEKEYQTSQQTKQDTIQK